MLSEIESKVQNFEFYFKRCCDDHGMPKAFISKDGSKECCSECFEKLNKADFQPVTLFCKNQYRDWLTLLKDFELVQKREQAILANQTGLSKSIHELFINFEKPSDKD